RVSARTGEWMVAEHGETMDLPLAIFFDTTAPPGEAFEAAVERTASLLWESDRGGRQARLYSWERSFPDRGRLSLRAALGFLAEIAPRPTRPANRAEFERWRRDAAAGAGIFVTAGDPPELPPGTLCRVA
ncbi:MAG: DUF58 domain-containing protein, partial [Candidatus Binatia bacterium]